MNANNKIIKSISGLLIFSILLPTVLFSAPKQTVAAAGATAATSVPVADIPQETAGWLSKALHAIATPSTVTNTTLHVKDFAAYLLRQVLMHIAKATLARITQATINWINSDFHGSPLFIENPDSFFRDIAKSEIRHLVDMIGYDTFRFPFGPQTALNVIDSYKRQLADNAQYTLSKVINDPDLLVRYRNDFNYGGWNGFLINTQYPQNNYLGFQGIIQQNLASRLEGTLVPPAQKIQSLLQQGMGFLSPQTCPSNPNYNNGTNEFLKPSFKPTTKYSPPTTPNPVFSFDGLPTPEYQAQLDAYNKEINDYNASYQQRVSSEKAKWAETNSCPGGLVNTTPGSVVGNHIMDALGSNLRQTELGAAFGNSLSAIFDALINHFLDKGLNALASSINPAPSNDNWSYGGQTFGDSTVVDLYVPTDVNVSVGYDTSIAISGGIGPYSIVTPPDSTKAGAMIDVSGSSGNKLRISGKNRGYTFVRIKDSSPTPKIATVGISVSTLGDLVITPAHIYANITSPFVANISGGTGPYSIRTSPKEDIATVAFADASMVIIGIAAGDTSVVIQDSSSPTKTVELPITISDPKSELNAQQDVSLGVGQTISIPVSGGTAPYIIDRVLDPGIATAQISASDSTGSTLTIIGGQQGETQTAVLIKDSSSPAKIISVNIKVVTIPPFLASPDGVVLTPGHSASVKISGGVPDYVIQGKPDANVATAQILEKTATLIITGVGKGATSVILQDKSSPANTTLVNITTILGICTNWRNGTKNTNMTEQECITRGWTWTP